MLLPFTKDQFLGVFASYNSAIEPFQLVFYALGLGCALILAAQAGIKAEVHTARLDDVNDVLDKMEHSSLPGRTVLEF